MQRRELVGKVKDAVVAGQAVEQGPPGGDSFFGGGLFPGGHAENIARTSTVRR